MQIMEKAKLGQLLDAMEQQYQVMVPVATDGFSQFAPYEMVTKQKATLWLAENVTLSPKTIFMPQSEALYQFKAQGKALEIEEIPREMRKQLIFAMRHCDGKAVACLDKVFLEEPYIDAQYLQKREQSIVFMLACNESKETCFCESMGVNRTNGEASVIDVQMYDLGDQYGFVPVSEKGQACLKELSAHFTTKETKPLGQQPQMMQFDVSSLPETLKGMFESEIWDDFAFKCLGCGTCAYICPSCHCFDINNKIRGEVGVKLRTWDSCMFDEYTLMAGGHQPRTEKKQRVRNRFLHKLQYFNEKYDMFLCTGCGRCVEKCPVNIDITRFIEKVLNQQQQGGEMQ